MLYIKNYGLSVIPIPIGLYYSAMTGRLGLRPMDEEYILMGMAGWGRGIPPKQSQHVC